MTKGSRSIGIRQRRSIGEMVLSGDLVYRFLALDRTGNEVLIRGAQEDLGSVIRAGEARNEDDTTLIGPICLGHVIDLVSEGTPWDGMMVLLDV